MYHLRLQSLGPVDPETVEKVQLVITDQEKARQERMSARPPLDEILNLHDFEVIVYPILQFVLFIPL